MHPFCPPDFIIRVPHASRHFVRRAFIPSEEEFWHSPSMHGRGVQFCLAVAPYALCFASACPKFAGEGLVDSVGQVFWSDESVGLVVEGNKGAHLGVMLSPCFGRDTSSAGKFF
ncbi:hypothetical protein BV22DRAFT_1028523 [Leucogyrophana mollusca]|uniref:Uncharacterized protein n=1 Tax=Leucogyrophana mollusca TaxID=85980 RepID=A0ACB8BXB4_9AGAM|nr:hypothetical protein BV22DRAFT_1028523 [Leucogyrophana mollusca]